jgi:soluble P-type ATPase
MTVKVKDDKTAWILNRVQDDIGEGENDKLVFNEAELGFCD